eukprot:IDg11200t1
MALHDRSYSLERSVCTVWRLQLNTSRLQLIAIYWNNNGAGARPAHFHYTYICTAVFRLLIGAFCPDVANCTGARNEADIIDELSCYIQNECQRLQVRSILSALHGYTSNTRRLVTLQDWPCSVKQST